MAVIRKRRTLHTKSSRQQQLQQQQQLRAKQRFESSRLKPEQSTTMIHDESDTISFRSYLLMNFVKGAEYMDVLMTQAVPNDKIRPPAIFSSSITLEAMKERLRVQKDQLRLAREELENFQFGNDGKLRFLENKLSETERGPDQPEIILKEYLDEFNLRSQADRAVLHRHKFNHLRGDTREAPADYWHQHFLRLKQEREKALIAKKKEEEEKLEKLRLVEMEKRQREIEADRKREELERQKQLEQMQKSRLVQEDSTHEHLTFPGSSTGSFTQAPPVSGTQYGIQEQGVANTDPLQLQAQMQGNGQQFFTEQASQPGEAVEQQQHQPLGQEQSAVASKQPQQQPQQPPPDAVESMFGGFDDEPFNNGFEDDFGELDTAFF